MNTDFGILDAWVFMYLKKKSIFFEFLDFTDFLDFWGFVLDCFGFFSVVLSLILKVNSVTTEHHKWPKISKTA